MGFSIAENAGWYGSARREDGQTLRDVQRGRIMVSQFMSLFIALYAMSLFL